MEIKLEAVETVFSAQIDSRTGHLKMQPGKEKQSIRQIVCTTHQRGHVRNVPFCLLGPALSVRAQYIQLRLDFFVCEMRSGNLKVSRQPQTLAHIRKNPIEVGCTEH